MMRKDLTHRVKHTDGCKMYRETYTINIGGSCNANNVNSGRIAAREACKLVGIA